MRLELCESGPLPGKYEPLNLLDYIRRLKTTRAARKVLPYRGGGPALQDPVAGHVDSYFGNPAEIVGQTGGQDPRSGDIGRNPSEILAGGADAKRKLPRLVLGDLERPGLSRWHAAGDDLEGQQGDPAWLAGCGVREGAHQHRCRCHRRHPGAL